MDYWDDLIAVMAWSKTNVTNTMHVCWGVQAGLYYHYGVDKYPFPKKLFGVFEHQVTDKKMPLFRGFDDVFLVPHSRYTATRLKDLVEIANTGVDFISVGALTHSAQALDISLKF